MITAKSAKLAKVYVPKTNFARFAPFAVIGFFEEVDHGLVWADRGEGE